MKKWWLGALAGLLVLAACGGGGAGPSSLPGSPAQTPTPSARPLPASTVPPSLTLAQGQVNGAAGYFTPPEGDTPAGANGSPVDSIPCANVMYNTFHVHAYLGIIVNGSWLADPTAIGMVDPGPASQGFVDTAQCFYWIHTHDSSGYIHMESPNAAPISSSEFTLGNVMDVWGMPLSMTQFGPWSGVVRIFIARVPAGTLTVPSSAYTEYTGGDPDSIPLYSHEVVWIEVNPPYTTGSQLPPVTFYTQY